MIRNYILDLFSETLLVSVLLFVIIKLILMKRARVKRNYAGVFFKSLQLHSYGSIRNTFDERLKKYLQSSNTVNKVFYVLVGIIVIVYFMMLMIS